ncbi:hypothetical protein Hanom_Chr04g00362771 [Helianthus anomalus]
MSFVLNVAKSCTLCSLGLTQLIFFVRSNQTRVAKSFYLFIKIYINKSNNNKLKFNIIYMYVSVDNTNPFSYLSPLPPKTTTNHLSQPPPPPLSTTSNLHQSLKYIFKNTHR